jgi:hypothetical protein
MSHYDETKNRFNPCNRFIGDIENGLRYPFACYTKEESDERYALKTEVDPAELEAEIEALRADMLNRMTALETAVSRKADESECVDIRARLDALEGDAIRINSFTASSTNYEKGASATVTLNWSVNKTPTTQTINNVAVTGNTQSYTGVTDSTTYTLAVSDGDTNDVQSASVVFANHIYYGKAVNLSSVNTLNSVVSDEIARRFTVTAGEGEYIIYAIPARLGSAVFYVDNWEGGFDAPVEQTITNASGYSETYKVYKSTNANLGTTTVEVREA